MKQIETPMDSVLRELNKLNMEELFDFNDILLQPAKTSQISSRSQIDPSYDGFLPIFTAPMDTVVSNENFRKYIELGINIVLPRGEAGNNDVFVSFSLTEIKEYFNSLSPIGRYLIDVANGHMGEIVEVVRDIKEEYPNLILMVGNVANPQTYKILSDAGADYVRVGIGNGNGCLTTQQLGVGYPMGSLIKDCYTVSGTLDVPAKIVADGGMKGYSDIIKALALGADYVMVGSLLNKTIESSGDNYLICCGIKIQISQQWAEYLYSKGFNISKKFRGMSTKEVQKKWGRKELKTSEGVVRFRPVEYTLKGWRDNMEDYLKSAMSYCNATTLSEFIGYAKYNRITQNAFLRFKK